MAYVSHEESDRSSSYLHNSSRSLSGVSENLTVATCKAVFLRAVWTSNKWFCLDCMPLENKAYNLKENVLLLFFPSAGFCSYLMPEMRGVTLEHNSTCFCYCERFTYLLYHLNMWCSTLKTLHISNILGGCLHSSCSNCRVFSICVDLVLVWATRLQHHTRVSGSWLLWGLLVFCWDWRRRCPVLAQATAASSHSLPIKL